MRKRSCGRSVISLMVVGGRVSSEKGLHQCTVWKAGRQVLGTEVKRVVTGEGDGTSTWVMEGAMSIKAAIGIDPHSHNGWATERALRG